MIRKTRGIFSYFYRNFLLPRFLSYKYRNILSKNLPIKNAYKNKRCFLIGGGPSVKEMDLGILKNEYTFVVAEFDKNPQYNILKPKFHILSDSTYFTDGESEHWNEMFKKKDNSINPDTTTLFINLGAKDFIKKYGLFKKHKIYFVGTQGIITNKFDFNIELDKFLPWPKNSILLTLMIAVYLGFKEIYLLGCEHNFLSYNIGKGKDLAYGHSYKDEFSKIDATNDKMVKKLAVPRDLDMTYEENVAHVLQLFKNYRLFNNKIKKLYPDVRIYNATPNSFLDVFPTINFENIILK